MTTPTDYTVADNTQESRYEARSAEGEVMGVLEYRRDAADTWVLPSTRTDPAFRGRGVAGTLTRRALDDARAAGASVVPVCWYVAEWIESHPEYADLVRD
ncbi:GNAT family N-acetyltransferase [Antribacter gilvus]|uniref:GNAT family N-acetyltransferase n=1 Tax=Antribacter gilvus TaxID=2304675 RepID=UPI000F77C300|nr:GNAT family N-acetyltransferase [Antribacter gilvus]